jgi:hypothetical protein
MQLDYDPAYAPIANKRACTIGYLNRPDRNLAMVFTVTRRCSS